MKPVAAACLAGAVLLYFTASGLGQENGDAKRGESLAKSVCAECHAIAGGERRSPDDAAPTFTTLATTPGMTAMALRVALRTSHREMPNLVLRNAEIDDLIAYIGTLK